MSLLSPLAAAREAADRPALCFDDGVLTYGALAEALAARIAWLAAVGAEGPVALVAALDRASLLWLYALLELGIPIVPLHPRLHAAEQDRQCAAVGATRLDPSLIKLPHPRGAQACGHAVPVVDDVRPLAIVMTSGSSGRPKGVELSRAAFVASAASSAENLRWHAGDRWLLGLPYAHIGGLSVLTRCLIARSTVVVAPFERFAPDLLIEYVAQRRVTLLSLVPTQLERLLAERPDWPPPPWLRAILLGGAAASAPVLEAVAALGWPVLPTYGLTEACSQVATLAPGAPLGPDVGCGLPLCGMDVAIRQGGRIALRSAALLTRYVATDETSPALLDAEGWFITSDLGQIDAQGHLHVLGRADDIIITGGENVAPAEVEAALRRQPGVATACVVGIPDARWGARVAAAVVAAPGVRLDLSALERTLAASLAPYKRPRRFITLETLPLLPSGKVDRRAVADALGQPGDSPIS